MCFSCILQRQPFVLQRQPLTSQTAPINIFRLPLPLRHIYRAPFRLVRLLLLLTALCLLLYFGLTKTRVGRDTLREQITRFFNDEFKGSIEIGNLKGNLVNDLYASQVILRDPSGKIVVRIDSLVASPDWWSMLEETISIRKITLFRPSVNLQQQANGRWNIEEVFAPQVKRAPNPNRIVWNIASAEVNIRQGRIQTASDASAPKIVQQGHVFDFTRTTISDLNLSASLDWRKPYKLIDLTGLSFHLPRQNFTLRKLEGQLLFDENQAILNHFFLQAGNSSIRLRASARGDSFAKKPFDFALFKNAPFQINLQQAIVRADDWKTLFPQVPLSDFTAVLKVKGQNPTYTFENLAIRQGETTLSGKGEVTTYPDSLSLRLNIADNVISVPDLEKWLPKAGLSSVRHLRKVNLSFDGRGRIGLNNEDFVFQANLQIRHPETGDLFGFVKAQKTTSTPLSYKLDLTTNRLNLGFILKNTNLASDLTGITRIEGIGTRLEDLDARVYFKLRDLHFDKYQADSLRLDGYVKNRQFDGLAMFAKEGGSIRTKGRINLKNPKPLFDLTANAERFNIGWLDPKAGITTKLTGNIQLNGSGDGLANFQGKAILDIEPSLFVVKGKETRTTDLYTTLDIRENDQKGINLEMTGDLATISLESGYKLDVFLEMGQYWLNAITRTISAEQAKRFRPDSSYVPPTLNVAAIDAERNKMSKRMGPHPIDRLPKLTEAFIKIKRGAFLTNLIPNFPYFDDSVELKWRSLGSPNTSSVELNISGDSLAVGTARLKNFDLKLAADSKYAYNLTNNLQASIIGQFERLHIAGEKFENTNLEFSYQYGGGQLYLNSSNLAGLGAFRTWANLDLLQDKNRLTIVELALTSPAYEWLIPKDQVIDLYTDALILNNLVVERRDNNPNMPNHTIRANGIVSALPEDEVKVRVENIDIGDLTKNLKGRDKFDGTLQGEFSIRRLFQSPDINGALTIENSWLNGTDFGTLNIWGNFEPINQVVNFNLQARQPLPSRFEVRNNDIDVSGKIGLPRGSREKGNRNPGFIDVAIDLRRLDLFFFKTLFPYEIDRVTGWGYGNGTVKGSFDKPIFDADLYLVESNFLVPYFNLTYGLSGPVSVDEHGIHLNKMTIADNTGGKSGVDGSILFNHYDFFSLDLAFNLDKLQLINVGDSKDLYWYGYIWASGPATLKGPLYKAFIDAPDLTTTPNSQLFIPITGSGLSNDEVFITFTDSTGQVPKPIKRQNLLSGRGTGERTFLDGLEMNANIRATSGSTIHLVFDPLLNDVIHAVGYGELQMQYLDASFKMFGDFNVESGDYLFTAFDIFRKPFKLERGGRMTWSGDPINAKLAIPASYKTNARTDGLEGILPSLDTQNVSRIPIKVGMDITGDVNSPIVDLRLAIDRDQRVGEFGNYEGLETEFNREDRATSYAFSVLLTNSFALASAIINPNNPNASVSDAGQQVVFTSLAQLVSAYLNRVVNQVIPNADINLGIYQGKDLTRLNELGLQAGIALRLFDERIVIRGEGILPNFDNADGALQNQFSGEVVFEYKISPNVSIEAFYRKNDRILGTNDVVSGESVGIGFNLQKTFSNWNKIFKRKKRNISTKKRDSALVSVNRPLRPDRR